MRTGSSFYRLQSLSESGVVFISEQVAATDALVAVSNVPEPAAQGRGRPLLGQHVPSGHSLMDPQTPQLGISGGEPMLLGDDLLRLVASCRDHLPNTLLHMPSNGRLFNYLTLAERLAGAGQRRMGLHGTVPAVMPGP